ncbi:hypothetical protein IKP13_08670 [bacterium]|jgi:CxxC-x17-CxxC domain-containing protein|nr:hypothetical protein [bacterium]
MKKEKTTLTSTKVVCAKCGKDYFVSFVADGHRNYYCSECLKEMHKSRKEGKIKKVFDPKNEKYMFDFICDICGEFRHAFYAPKRENGKIMCKECESKQKLEERKRSRKNVIIASGKAALDSIPKKEGEDDE